MLNDTLDLDSDDEYRLIGTLTSPNEMVAEAIERAGIGSVGLRETAVGLAGIYVGTR
jgi:hypothetical protein